MCDTSKLNNPQKKVEIKNRFSNIELLRILASIGVILIHYNSIAHSYIDGNTINRYYLCALDIIVDCAVNLFVMISGFFLCNTDYRQVNKIVGLIVQFVFFRSVLYILLAIIKGTPLGFVSILNLLLPVNYYIVLYSVLYIISPYLNIVIRNLDIRAFGKFVMLLFILFSVETWIVDVLQRITDESYVGLSSIGLNGSQNGFTIINFIVCYYIGAYVRQKIEWLKKVRINILFVLTTFVFVVLSLMNITQYVNQIDLATLNYNNPLLITLSAFLFILFCRIGISSVIINRLAKASFTCFILHSSFLPYLGIDKVVNESLFVLILHQVIVSIGLFAISYLVYLLYECVLCSMCRKVFERVRDKIK